jgi:hypothetical protein
MIRNRYNLVFYGEITEGYRVEDVRHNLASQLKLDPETREKLFAGKSVIIREHVDYQAVLTLRTTCELNGAICHVELARVDTQYNTIDVSKLCNIEFCGETVIGHQVEDVKDKLRVLLKADRQTIEQLFSGKHIVIKKDIDYQTALNIQAGFEQAGAICRIKASNKSTSPEQALKDKIFLPTNLEMMICPKCGCKQKLAPICVKCGIVVQRFVKKRRKVVKRATSKKTSPLEKQEGGDTETPQEEYAEEEYEDIEEYEEEVAEEEEIGPQEIPIWQIGLVGNVILTLLVTLFGISFYNIMVTFSLDPEIYNADAEFKNIFARLFSNVQLAGLMGPLIPLVMFFRRSFYAHKDRGLHYKFWAALFIVLGATLMIDVFVTAFGGFPFVGVFTLKAFGLSAIAYMIGVGIFLGIRREKTTTPIEPEESEVFDEEETNSSDSDVSLGTPEG